MLNAWRFCALGNHLKRDEQIFELLERMTATLGKFLGPSTEIVLHDLRKPDRTIVALANHQMSGRKVGDTLELLGKQLFAEHHYQDMPNYETRTEKGHTLRSCTVFVRDEKGQPIGALCVNQDLSPLLAMQNWLTQTLQRECTESASASEENHVENVLTSMIDEAIRSTGKLPERFSREDKLSVISYLDRRGAFQIRYSMEKVAALLNISKFSIYNYLGSLREEEPADGAL